MILPGGDPSAHGDSPRWRYSIRGMMVFVAGVAVGLAVAGPGGDYVGGLLAAVAFWFALGLVSQARDLWTTFRGRVDLSSDERWGWRLAAGWRVGLACILLGHLLVDFLVVRKFVVFPELQIQFSLIDAVSQRAVLLVALAVALLSTSQASLQQRRPTWWRRLVDLLAVITGAYLGLCVWADSMLIPMLVHVSTVGIEQSQPLRYAIQGIDDDVTARTMLFFWWTVAALCVAAVNVFVIRQLARQWTSAWRYRAMWSVACVLCLVLSGAYVIWAATFGFKGVSPFLAQSMVAAPWHMWVRAAVLLLMMVTGAVFRLCRGSESLTTTGATDWRSRPMSYHHERTAPAVLLLVVIVWSAVQVTRDFETFGAIEAIGYFFVTPYSYLLLAVFFPALARCIDGLRRRSQAPPSTIPGIRPLQFTVVWMALLLVIVFAVPAIAALSFLVWLIPQDVFPLI